MSRILAQIIAWFLRILGVTFDFRELWQFAGGSGVIGIAPATVASIGGLPIWVVILLWILGTILMATIWAIVTGKRSYTRIRKIPRILKEMDKRARDLALGKAQKRLNNNTVDHIFDDWADAIGMPKEQMKEAKAITNHLDKRREEALKKRMASSMKTKSVESSLLDLAVLMEQHDIGLQTLANKDFRYSYLKGQIDNLRPMPTVKINDCVARYLSCSYALNSLLMIRQPYLSDIGRTLSVETAVESMHYERKQEEGMNQLLSSISEVITEYLKQNG